ncbi:hypothetical protein [Actinoallomurus acaciae]|uniref:Uncharacterized protein n=1 Tax=Actinoallomurus acaciae TaxID=502577 RepID=A0ABV5Y935_9ACTN
MGEGSAVVVVHPPGPRGRLVTVEGRTAGYALDRVDLLWLIWDEGLDPEEVRLDDPDWVEWREAGPDVWGRGGSGT